MTSNLQRDTAKIYVFPARGRFATPDPREAFRREAASLRNAPAPCSGSWYHEEAIREAERNRKN
jgi:hypothetical protein